MLFHFSLWTEAVEIKTAPPKSERSFQQWDKGRECGKPERVSFYQLHLEAVLFPVMSSDTALQHSCQISYAGSWGIFFRVSFLVQIESTFFPPSLLVGLSHGIALETSLFSSPKIKRNLQLPPAQKARRVAVSWQQAPRWLRCRKQYVGCIFGERMCWGKWSEKYCSSLFPLSSLLPTFFWVCYVTERISHPFKWS